MSLSSHTYQSSCNTVSQANSVVRICIHPLCLFQGNMAPSKPVVRTKKTTNLVYLCSNMIKMLSAAKTTNRTICSKDIWGEFSSCLCKRARQCKWSTPSTVLLRGKQAAFWGLYTSGRRTDRRRGEAKTAQKCSNGTRGRMQETELPT